MKKIWYYNDKLNKDQQIAYNRILNRVIFYNSGAFLTDGLGGTVKTFLHRMLLPTVRHRGFVALATIFFGVAASLFLGGRTTYSSFKITYRNWWKYYLQY